MAHTSPVYVAVGGEWTLYDPGVATYMVTLRRAAWPTSARAAVRIAR